MRQSGGKGAALMFRLLQLKWQSLSLAWQFVLTAAALMLAGMLVIGVWVSDRIRRGIVDNTAAASVAHINSELAALAHVLVSTGVMSEEIKIKLAAAQKSIGDKALSIKIWRRDGTVIYSTWPEMIGRQFPVTRGLRTAFSGQIVAEHDGEAHEGDEHDLEFRGAVIEIYAPVWDAGGNVIAVAEYYSRQPQLANDLTRATLSSWLIVGTVTLVMITALLGIVRGGSRIIDTQRRSLQLQISELTRLLQQNDELKGTVQRAHRRSAQINERVLRRIGSELHDGPAQLLSLALLLIDNIREPAGSRNGKAGNDRQVDHIRGVLRDALGEIRAISAGLGMPDIEKLGLEDIARAAGQMHSVRTGTSVALEFDIAEPAIAVPQPLKICIYRMIQEGLNNCFRHAEAKGQSVAMSVSRDKVVVTVSDQGPGLRNSNTAGNTTGLGLLGLRDRVETLGGRLTIASAHSGCQLVACFNLNSPEISNVDHDP